MIWFILVVLAVALFAHRSYHEPHFGQKEFEYYYKHDMFDYEQFNNGDRKMLKKLKGCDSCPRARECSGEGRCPKEEQK